MQETNVVAWWMMNFTAGDLSVCGSATGHLQLENAKLGEETKGRKKNLLSTDLGGKSLLLHSGKKITKVSLL